MFVISHFWCRKDRFVFTKKQYRQKVSGSVSVIIFLSSSLTSSLISSSVSPSSLCWNGLNRIHHIFANSPKKNHLPVVTTLITKSFMCLKQIHDCVYTSGCHVMFDLQIRSAKFKRKQLNTKETVYKTTYTDREDVIHFTHCCYRLTTQLCYPVWHSKSLLCTKVRDSLETLGWFCSHYITGVFSNKTSCQTLGVFSYHKTVNECQSWFTAWTTRTTQITVGLDSGWIFLAFCCAVPTTVWLT